jgi:hypothetical protein
LTTTDTDAEGGQIEANIAHNCALNGVEHRHLPHRWGAPLPPDTPRFDFILATDILIYVNAYPALVASLVSLLRPEGERREAEAEAEAPSEPVAGRGCFLLAARRRVQEEQQLFARLRAAGFRVRNLGTRFFLISA